VVYLFIKARDTHGITDLLITEGIVSS